MEVIGTQHFFKFRLEYLDPVDETLQPNKQIKVHMILIFASSTYTKVTPKYFPLYLKELYIPVIVNQVSKHVANF
jgi:hypothetical protein